MRDDGTSEFTARVSIYQLPSKLHHYSHHLSVDYPGRPWPQPQGLSPYHHSEFFAPHLGHTSAESFSSGKRVLLGVHPFYANQAQLAVEPWTLITPGPDSGRHPT